MASSTSQQQQQPAAASSQQPTKGEEFVVRVPALTEKKKHSVLKFSSSLGIDVTQWNQIGLTREDNAQVFVEKDSDPKFGAGSEYGKQQRQEARRKKLGFRSRKYRIDDQPWIMNLPGKQERRFRGQKEGGVAEHADYWIFVKAAEGVFDAYPISDWYNFMPMSRYKTLDIDEAEEQFQMRNRVLNQFALKSLLKTESADEEGSKRGAKSSGYDSDTGKKTKVARGDDDDVEDVGPTKGQLKAKAKRKQPKKSKKQFSMDDDDPMASADSDDGDEEGREMDYISSTSESDEDEMPAEETRNDRGVDEEVGMRQLLEENEDEDEEAEKEGEGQKTDLTKAESMPTTGFDDGDERESESGSDSDDPDKEDIKSALWMIPQKQKTDAASSPAAAGPSDTALKRKLQSGAEGTDQPSAKKHKADKESKPKDKDKPASMEEEVCRYLQRRPLSTTDLVTKFKKRCAGMSKQEIVQKLADILKRLKPEQERRNGVLYFSLKKKE